MIRPRVGSLNAFFIHHIHREGLREGRRCSRQIYPESYITEYSSVYEDDWLVAKISLELLALVGIPANNCKLVPLPASHPMSAGGPCRRKALPLEKLQGTFQKSMIGLCLRTYARSVS